MKRFRKHRVLEVAIQKLQLLSLLQWFLMLSKNNTVGEMVKRQISYTYKIINKLDFI